MKPARQMPSKKGLMTMTRWFSLVYPMALLACLFLAGCGSSSSKKEKDPEPAELVDFRPDLGLKKLWVQTVGSGLGSTYTRIDPVLVGSGVLVASVDGSIMLLDQESGEPQWRKMLDQTISGGIGIGWGSAPLFFLGTFAGEVIAFRADNGEEQWRSKLSSEVLSPPVTNGDLLVVHTFDGKLYGLEEATGKQRWVYDGNLPVLTMRGTSQPVFYEGLILVGQANGKLIALDRDNGQLRWERRVAIAQGKSEIERIVDVDASPFVSGGLVYAVSFQGRLVAFEAATGRPVWQARESSYSDMAEGFGNIYVSGSQGQVSAYNKSDGSIRWAQDALERRQLTAPRTINSYVAVADFEGYLHLLSQVDGHLSARRPVDSDGVRTPVLVQGDKLYVYGNSGKLAAYRLNPDAKFYRPGSQLPQRDEVMQKPGMHPYGWHK
jgi:outer membrane protein assembly factor BamB